MWGGASHSELDWHVLSPSLTSLVAVPSSPELSMDLSDTRTLLDWQSGLTTVSGITSTPPKEDHYGLDRLDP